MSSDPEQRALKEVREINLRLIAFWGICLLIGPIAFLLAWNLESPFWKLTVLLFFSIILPVSSLWLLDYFIRSELEVVAQLRQPKPNWTKWIKLSRLELAILKLFFALLKKTKAYKKGEEHEKDRQPREARSFLVGDFGPS